MNSTPASAQKARTVSFMKTVIVRIEAEQRKRHRLPDLVQHVGGQDLLANQQRGAFRPAVAMSVSTRGCRKLLRATGPQCTTRSASTKPGAESFQSAKVLIATARLTADNGLTVGPLFRPSPDRS